VLRVSGGPVAVQESLANAPLFAPKAVALTLFARTFIGDMFIHGVGGGRYDAIADGVSRTYYGVEPLAYAVASMTMYLPLRAHAVTPQQVERARRRVDRFRHNPDSMLGEVDFDSLEERDRARGLAEEKARLIERVASPDIDKRELSAMIRKINGELRTMLGPLEARITEDLRTLEDQLAASEVLTDRTYPFCFWDPREVQDKLG
jgi:hypothetical protein